MASRIQIFDHFCKHLKDLGNIPTTPRSWILNAYGKCEFSLGFDSFKPQSQQLARQQYLQFGNFVHITHLPSTDWNLSKKGKLPDWTGIILPDQDWDTGAVHVTAYSLEALLAFRPMPYLSIEGTPKDVFTQIIQLSQSGIFNNVTIQYGVLDNLAKTFSDNLRTNAYDHIIKLIGRSGMDFDLQGSVNDDGNLEIFANLYIRKGIDTPLVLDNKNSEAQSPRLKLQGTISNYVIGYSQAVTPENRVSSVKMDQDSINDYGPLGINQVYVGSKDLNTVENSAQNRINNRSRPAMRLTRNALDARKCFDFLNIGNSITVKDSTVGFNLNGYYGFEKSFRILGMEYNDLANKTPLVIEAL